MTKLFKIPFTVTPYPTLLSQSLEDGLSQDFDIPNRPHLLLCKTQTRDPSVADFTIGNIQKNGKIGYSPPFSGKPEKVKSISTAIVLLGAAGGHMAHFPRSWLHQPASYFFTTHTALCFDKNPDAKKSDTLPPHLPNMLRLFLTRKGSAHNILIAQRHFSILFDTLFKTEEHSYTYHFFQQ